MEGKAGEKSEVRRWSFWKQAFHGEGKRDNVVFVWRDWCVLGLWGPQSDCGTTDSLSDLGKGAKKKKLKKKTNKC